MQWPSAAARLSPWSLKTSLESVFLALTADAGDERNDTDEENIEDNDSEDTDDQADEGEDEDE